MNVHHPIPGGVDPHASIPPPKLTDGVDATSLYDEKGHRLSPRAQIAIKTLSTEVADALSQIDKENLSTEDLLQLTKSVIKTAKGLYSANMDLPELVPGEEITAEDIAKIIQSVQLIDKQVVESLMTVKMLNTFFGKVTAILEQREKVAPTQEQLDVVSNALTKVDKGDITGADLLKLINSVLKEVGLPEIDPNQPITVENLAKLIKALQSANQQVKSAGNFPILSAFLGKAAAALEEQQKTAPTQAQWQEQADLKALADAKGKVDTPPPPSTVPKKNLWFSGSAIVAMRMAIEQMSKMLSDITVKELEFFLSQRALQLDALASMVTVIMQEGERKKKEHDDLADQQQIAMFADIAGASFGLVGGLGSTGASFLNRNKGRVYQDAWAKHSFIRDAAKFSQFGTTLTKPISTWTQMRSEQIKGQAEYDLAVLAARKEILRDRIQLYGEGVQKAAQRMQENREMLRQALDKLTQEIDKALTRISIGHQGG